MTSYVSIVQVKLALWIWEYTCFGTLTSFTRQWISWKTLSWIFLEFWNESRLIPFIKELYFLLSLMGMSNSITNSSKFFLLKYYQNIFFLVFKWKFLFHKIGSWRWKSNQSRFSLILFPYKYQSSTQVECWYGVREWAPRFVVNFSKWPDQRSKVIQRSNCFKNALRYGHQIWWEESLIKVWCIPGVKGHVGSSGVNQGSNCAGMLYGYQI